MKIYHILSISIKIQLFVTLKNSNGKEIIFYFSLIDNNIT
jgi:hypothetical protein